MSGFENPASCHANWDPNLWKKKKKKKKIFLIPFLLFRMSTTATRRTLWQTSSREEDFNFYSWKMSGFEKPASCHDNWDPNLWKKKPFLLFRMSTTATKRILWQTSSRRRTLRMRRRMDLTWRMMRLKNQLKISSGLWHEGKCESSAGDLGRCLNKKNDGKIISFKILSCCSTL